MSDLWYNKTDMKAENAGTAQQTSDLTPREQEICDLLLKGIAPKEIAYKLDLKHSTVVFHRGNLYRKLGIQSIQELFAFQNSIKNTKKIHTKIASPKKPLIFNFYDNKIYNPPNGWQYIFSAPAFYDLKITSGDIYTFKYSFTSNINFDTLLFSLIDNSVQADGFYTPLGPNIRAITYGKANIKYSDTLKMTANKDASSTKPNANQIWIDIVANTKTAPVITFTELEIEKIN